MSFPFYASAAAFRAGASGVVGLALAVVEFGDELTADGVALWAFPDAAGDADLVPVNGMLRLDRFNGFAVGGFGLVQDHASRRALGTGENSNALDEFDAPLAMNTFNNCTACHDYAEWTAKPWSRNCLAKLFSASSAAAFVEATGLSSLYKMGLSPPFMWYSLTKRPGLFFLVNSLLMGFSVKQLQIKLVPGVSLRLETCCLYRHSGRWLVCPT